MKTNKVKEAVKLKQHLKDVRIELELMDLVMNLDFSKPKEKLRKLAEE